MFSEVLEDSQVIEFVRVSPQKLSRSFLKLGEVRQCSLRFAKVRLGSPTCAMALQDFPQFSQVLWFFLFA